MALITDTYTDNEKCNGYLALSLFDAATIDADMALQAINARDKIDAFLGRTVCFTVTELAQTQFSAVVDSASQLTACLVQQNPQAAAATLTEDTKVDCAEAWKTITNWALTNGIEPPDIAAKPKHIQDTLVYQYNNPDEMI